MQLILLYVIIQENHRPTFSFQSNFLNNILLFQLQYLLDLMKINLCG